LAPEDHAPLARFLGISEEQLRERYLEPITRFGTTLFRTRPRRQGKPYGPCIFFNEEKGCTIHPVKPLECKVAHCSDRGEQHSIWFALNYFVNPADADSLREWELCLRLGCPTIPGGTIDELQQYTHNGGT
jgi:Fe-S-cluster containining protein